MKIAREIAIDHFGTDVIRERFHLTQAQWDGIVKNPNFTKLLEREIEDWNSAINTTERTRLKAAALIEEWLPEANTRMHAGAESLNHKVELAKLVAKIAGMDRTNPENIQSSERFSVTINMGENKQVNIERDVTPKVIDAE